MALLMRRKHGIMMVTFYPHPLHKLQLLDRTVYRPFKIYYNSALDNWMMENPATTFSFLELLNSRNKGKNAKQWVTSMHMWVLTTRHGRMLSEDKEISCTESRAVYQSKAFCFQISFCSYPHGCECWIKTERVRSRVQAAEIFFVFRKVRGLPLLDKVESTDICQSLNIEPLLVRIEQLQLRWYSHVTRMSHEQIAK